MKTFITSLVAVVVLTGCVGIKYSSQHIGPQGTNIVSISANRFFWSTESYSIVLNTNGGGSLQASKATVDSVALGAVAQGVAQGLSAVK